MAKKINTEKIVTLILCVLVLFMVALVVIQNTVGLNVVFGGSAAVKQASGGAGPGGRRSSGSGNAAVNVEIQKAEKTTFIKTISINGELFIKDSERNVIADTTGKITEILVRRGDTVYAGQVVAKADPSTPGAEYKIKEIRSTVSGKVLSVPGYVGQSLSANTAVITVGNPEDLVLKLNVPEKYLSDFSIGSEASFTTAAYPDYTYTGKVSYIGSTVNVGTRTVEVEIEIEKPDKRLMAGMFVRARLVVEKQEGVFTVPSESVSTYLNNQTLYLVGPEGKAQRIIVNTGSYNDSVTVITDGLKEGDNIIVLGTVTEGAAVNVINQGITN